MIIGVIGFQGAISEHITSIEKAMKKQNINGRAIWLNDKKQLSKIDGLIIPGGESTTIGRLMLESGIFNEVKKLGEKGLPILGTCAGLILLAKEGGEEIRKTNQPLLKLMNIKVKRNAFGRQKESFETNLKIPFLGKEPFLGVFIRAPAIGKIGEKVYSLAEYKNKIVAAEQENLVTMAFHPELTNDTRAHEYFLRKTKKTSFKR